MIGPLITRLLSLYEQERERIAMDNPAAIVLGSQFTAWANGIYQPQTNKHQILVNEIKGIFPSVKTWSPDYQSQLLSALDQLSIVLGAASAEASGGASRDTAGGGNADAHIGIYEQRHDKVVNAIRQAFMVCFEDTKEWDVKDEQVWVPDNAYPDCQLCHRPFTWRHRRHHCRECGKLICSDCSHFYTDPFSFEPIRICSDCHHKSIANKPMELHQIAPY